MSNDNLVGTLHKESAVLTVHLISTWNALIMSRAPPPRRRTATAQSGPSSAAGGPPRYSPPPGLAPGSGGPGPGPGSGASRVGPGSGGDAEGARPLVDILSGVEVGAFRLVGCWVVALEDL